MQSLRPRNNSRQIKRATGATLYQVRQSRSTGQQDWAAGSDLGWEDESWLSEMTWRDLVRKHIPNATDEECNHILWNLTCFPLCGVEEVQRQLAELAEERREVAE